MAALITMSELRTMQRTDLLREFSELRHTVVKLRLAITMRKEKNSAKYRREKRQLARMQTVLSEKRHSSSQL